MYNYPYIRFLQYKIFNKQPSTMKNRIAYYDILRGIAIIGVLIGHSSSIGLSSKDTSYDFIITVILRLFINFCVPLFLALSGFFLANKKVEQKNDYKHFIIKQIPRVLYPYFIWSIFYSIMLFLRGENINTIIYKYFTFQSSSPMYFIILIIQYYLLLPLLKKLANPRGLIVSAVISLSCSILIIFFREYTTIQLPLIVYAGFFPTYLIFFVLGLYLRNNEIRLSNQQVFPLIILFYILSWLETYLLYIKFNDISTAANPENITSFLYSMAIIIFFFQNVREGNIKGLSYLGEISFGIYFTHIIILGRIAPTILIWLIPQFISYGFISQIILVITALTLCILIAYTTRKINKNIATKYLGQ